MPADDDLATIRTDRLLLRAFTDVDRAPFATMNADPVVMEHFPATKTRAESDGFVDRIVAHWAEHGWGLWALERTDTRQFIGYTGLWPILFDAPFEPRVEIGWRLAAEHWGHGFATEAARAALDVAFGPLALTEIVSFTAVGNVRSQRVMERIGMHREPAWDFEHPSVPAGHPTRQTVTYRLRANDRAGAPASSAGR